MLLQGADFFLDLAGAPEWVMRALFILAAIGLPAVLAFSWAFEMTPEGIKREAEVDRSQTQAPYTARKIDKLILVFLALAVVSLLVERFLPGSEQAPSAQEQAAAVTEPDQSTADSPSNNANPVLTEEPSIAVLPFADMSAEGDQAYFSDGIAEELLNLLVRVDGLKVASRTSSFAFKNTGQSIGDIASELKVNHVLEGSVRKADNRVRITAQLIDTNTDRHLWSDTYDRELDDIFAIQDEIATAIVDALQAELGVLEDAQIEVSASTANLDAYQLFLEARALYNARDRLAESIALYERAVELDPEFALAWEGLSAVYSVAPSWRIRDRDYSALAVVAADTALALNPTLSTAWAVKAQAMLDRDGEHVAAMEAFAEAIRNDPNNTDALLWRSVQWFSLGFTDSAIKDAENCIEVDPGYLNCSRFLARYHLQAGNEAEALDHYLANTEKGFFGTDYSFLPMLIDRGDRLTAAMVLWSWNGDDRSYPAKLILDALEYPDRDHSTSRAAFNSWLKARGHDPENFRIDLVILGDYAQVFETANAATFSNHWMFEPPAAGFRKSPYFKKLLIKLNFPEFWREFGFPPNCRPLGYDDFECDP